MTERASAPRLCPGGTVLCVASGPSLTQDDVDACRDRVDAVIVVNNSYKLAPWATALYAADSRWWVWENGAPTFPGLKFSLSREASRWGVTVLKATGDHGLDLNPTGLRTGRNGGYQAINLAVHFGARKIILLGYDMGKGPKGEEHWHKDHPNRSRSPYGLFIQKYSTLVAPLAAAGIEVVNCSRRSALKCFPTATIDQALTREVAA